MNLTELQGKLSTYWIGTNVELWDDYAFPTGLSANIRRVENSQNELVENVKAIHLDPKEQRNGTKGYYFAYSDLEGADLIAFGYVSDIEEFVIQ